MNADMLFRMLMGHLIGDYLLQTNKMALNKKKDFWWASLHCLIWTLCIYACLFNEINKCSCGMPLALGLIWFSHMIFDFGWGTKHGLIELWLHLIGSRSYQRAEVFCSNFNPTPAIYKTFMVAYTAIVQTVADNACHLILLYLILRLCS